MSEASVKSKRRKAMQHLKKCPVCKSHMGVFVSVMEVDGGTKWERNFVQIRCKRCDVSTRFYEGHDAEILANDAWNKRDGVMCDTTKMHSRGSRKRI